MFGDLCFKNDCLSVGARGHLNSVKPNFCPFFRCTPLGLRYVFRTPYAPEAETTELIVNGSLSGSIKTQIKCPIWDGGVACRLAR